MHDDDVVVSSLARTLKEGLTTPCPSAGLFFCLFVCFFVCLFGFSFKVEIGSRTSIYTIFRPESVHSDSAS